MGARDFDILIGYVQYLYRSQIQLWRTDGGRGSSL